MDKNLEALVCANFGVLGHRAMECWDVESNPRTGDTFLVVPMRHVEDTASLLRWMQRNSVSTDFEQWDLKIKELVSQRINAEGRWTLRLSPSVELTQLETDWALMGMLAFKVTHFTASEEISVVDREGEEDGFVRLRFHPQDLAILAVLQGQIAQVVERASSLEVDIDIEFKEKVVRAIEELGLSDD